MCQVNGEGHFRPKKNNPFGVYLDCELSMKKHIVKLSASVTTTYEKSTICADW